MLKPACVSVSALVEDMKKLDHILHIVFDKVTDCVVNDSVLLKEEAYLCSPCRLTLLRQVAIRLGCFDLIVFCKTFEDLS